jgi:hypothetical protein
MINNKGAELLKKYTQKYGSRFKEMLEDDDLNRTQKLFSAFARRGGRFSIIDPGMFVEKGSNYSKGYIPNFANGLKDSVNREVDALIGMGYPKSLAMGSVKVGTSERLKNRNNPNGLGVYNLAQGQMTLGQAIGQHSSESQSKKFIPNFADPEGRLIISPDEFTDSGKIIGKTAAKTFTDDVPIIGQALDKVIGKTYPRLFNEFGTLMESSLKVLDNLNKGKEDLAARIKNTQAPPPSKQKGIPAPDITKNPSFIKNLADQAKENVATFEGSMASRNIPAPDIDKLIKENKKAQEIEENKKEQADLLAKINQISGDLPLPDRRMPGALPTPSPIMASQAAARAVNQKIQDDAREADRQRQIEAINSDPYSLMPMQGMSVTQKMIEARRVSLSSLEKPNGYDQFSDYEKLSKQLSSRQFGMGTQDIISQFEGKIDQKDIVSRLSNYKNQESEAFKQLSSKAGIFTSEKKLNKLAEKLNISTASDQFLNLQSNLSSRRGSAISAASFGLPFVTSGISQALGGEKTSAGRTATAVGEAGATLAFSSQFGVPGLVVGSIVSGFQLITAAAGELKPNLEELSKKSQELTASNERQLSSMQQYTQAIGQLNALTESGASPSSIAQARVSLTQAASSVSGPYRTRLLNAQTDEERSQILQEATGNAQRQQAQVDTKTIIAAAIKEQTAGFSKSFVNVYDAADEFMGGILPGQRSRQIIDTNNLSAISGEIVKSIDLESLSKNTLTKIDKGTATLKDLGLNPDTFKDVDKFLTAAGESASSAILKFTQSILSTQKATDDLIKSQVDAAASFGQSKQTFLNLLQSTFAANESKGAGARTAIQSNLTTASNFLQANEKLLSPEALISGREQIQKAEIQSATVDEKTALTNEYSQKIIADILAKSSGISLDEQRRVQDSIQSSIASPGGFDPAKLAQEIEKTLEPGTAMSLQSDILKTNIEMGQKLEAINNKAALELQKTEEQIAIAQKQLSDTRLINLLGGFKSDFQSVLETIQVPKGGFTNEPPIGNRLYTFGRAPNLNGAKEGTTEGELTAQDNAKRLEERVNFIKSLNMSEGDRAPILTRLKNDIAANVESQNISRTAMLGQAEVVSPLEQLSKLTTNTYAKDEIGKQIKLMQQTLKVGELPQMSAQFIDTVRNSIPLNGPNSQMGNDLFNQFLEGTQMVNSVARSRKESAAKTAEDIVGDQGLPPEFKANIDAISKNVSQLDLNTQSLKTLEQSLNDLPTKLQNLQTLTTGQKVDAQLKQQLTERQSKLVFSTKQLEAAKQRPIIERLTTAAATRSYGSDPVLLDTRKALKDLSLAGDIKYASGDRVENSPDFQDFFEFLQSSNIKPTDAKGLEDALKNYLEEAGSEATMKFYNRTPEELFQKTKESTEFKSLTSDVTRNPSLFTTNASEEGTYKAQVEALQREINELNKRIQDNSTQVKAATTVSNNTSVNAPVEINIAAQGPVNEKEIKNAVMQAMTEVFKESNTPLPIQRPTSNTATA